MTFDRAFLVGPRELEMNATVVVKSVNESSLRAPAGTAVVHQASARLGPDGLPSSRLRPERPARSACLKHRAA